MGNYRFWSFLLLSLMVTSTCIHPPPETERLGLEAIRENNPPSLPTQGGRLRFGANFRNQNSGHNIIIKHAITNLIKLDLLPPALQGKEQLDNLHYGVSFADHSWMGLPSSFSTAAINPMTKKITRYKCLHGTGNPPGHNVPIRANGQDEIVTERCECAEPAAGVVDQTYASNDLAWWPFGGTIRIRSGIEWQRGCDGFDRPSVTPYWNLDVEVLLTNVMSIKNIALDNLFHFPFDDIKIFGTQSEDGVLRAHDINSGTILEQLSGAGFLLLKTYTPLRREIARKLNNQRILSSPGGYGSVSYAAILFQLARKFFDGSRAGPRKSELILVSNPFSMRGEPPFERLKLDFPSTYLGGMPFICYPGNTPSPCSQPGAQAIWPVWVSPRIASLSADGFKDLLVEYPGRSNRVAAIYLGWAAHLLQDNMIPSHAANWHGPTHEKQESFSGYAPLYDGPFRRSGRYEKVQIDEMDKVLMCGDTPALVSPDTFFGQLTGDPVIGCEAPTWVTLDQFIAEESARRFSGKSRKDICEYAGISDNQVVPMKLNHRDLLSFFAKQAKVGYELRNVSPHNSLLLFRNAVMGTMELIMCAVPIVAVDPLDCEVNGQRRCNGDKPEICANRVWESSESCQPDGAESFCIENRCLKRQCQESSYQCVNGEAQKCLGGQWKVSAECSSRGGRCLGNQCIDNDGCENGEFACLGDSAQRCVNGSWQRSSVCSIEKGHCVDNVCVNPSSCAEGATRCVGDRREICRSGSWFGSKCKPTERCTMTEGAAECRPTG